jgi:polyhydroxyalkanoate synthase
VGKREHETDYKEWRAKHAQVPGTWWDDWNKWLTERCGPMQAPPPVARPPYEVLAAAPGTYVVEH